MPRIEYEKCLILGIFLLATELKCNIGEEAKERIYVNARIYSE